MIQSGADTRFMAAALALGRRGLGLCAPNPAVGALVVKDGVIVARGWTKPGGRPHAETEALREAGAQARGATLYVTLEPCSHHGETPPCTDAIIAAGAGRVVYAVDDPDPRACGRGAQILADVGIEVTRGVLAEEALRANLGHFLRVTRKRPMITLKLAVTADFYAAGPAGDPRLVITGAPANGLVHVMRAMNDAVMTGIGTILADDSLLSVRLPGLEDRKPLRVVLDGDLRLPPLARLAATAAGIPTLAIACEGASEARAERLREAHIEVAHVRRDGAGRVDLDAALTLLAARGLTRIFCEGGPRVAAGLIGQGLADEVIIFTAPKSLGRDGILGLDADTAALLGAAAHYRLVETRMIGADRLTRYERVVSCSRAL
ncbi:MAG: bifunctional diaminohydroxyphosphoribosylaminopyrimidine deaminase/5-amino-6-(5-phosphoribosylamino)uracil reductase RibD [Pseudomonadota bacterium]|nr:bifunctional diaminohydroxyphosphoribosylaminopyrimidine deaminase/5-amino-6-(5-phosphoribosylamino)uracil reductase RibD [Pseudomonadota bacterium]